MTFRAISVIVAAVIAGILAGCSGGGSSPAAPVRQPAPPPSASPIPSNAPGLENVVFRIDAGSVSTAATKRRPNYLSPAMQSLALTISPSSGRTPVSIAIGLTPASALCTQSLATTTCSGSLQLLDGSYTATIATYDGPLTTNGQVSGNVLSENQQVAFSVSPSANNVVGITLFGVPATIVLTPDASETRALGSQDTGYALIGTGDETFDISARDASGNIIMGPGSPQYSVTSSGSQVVVDTQPTIANGNRFTVRGPAFAPSPATVTVAVTNASTYGVLCTTCSLAVKMSAGALWNIGAIVTSTGSFATSASWLIGVDDSNDLYSGDFAFVGPDGAMVTTTLTAFAPPYRNSRSFSLPVAVPNGSASAEAVDPAGTIYAIVYTPSNVSDFGPATLYEIPPPYQTATPIWSGTTPEQYLSYIGAVGSGKVAFRFSNCPPVFCSATEADVIYERSSEGSPVVTIPQPPAQYTSQNLSAGADGSFFVTASSPSGSQITQYGKSATPYVIQTSTDVTSVTSDALGNVYIASPLLLQRLPPLSQTPTTISTSSYALLVPTDGGVIANGPEQYFYTVRPTIALDYVAADGSTTPYAIESSSDRSLFDFDYSYAPPVFVIR